MNWFLKNMDKIFVLVLVAFMLFDYFTFNIFGLIFDGVMFIAMLITIKTNEIKAELKEIYEEIERVRIQQNN